MANEVTNNITIHFNDPKTGKKASELFDWIRENENFVVPQMFPDKPSDDLIDRTWMEENVGAKWARLGDEIEIARGDDGSYYDAHMNVGTAWSALTLWVERLVEYLESGFTLTHTYVDESLMFVGSNVWEDTDLIYSFEDLEFYTTTLPNETSRRAKEEGKLLENMSESETDEWQWDWMWDFVYDTVEPPEEVYSP